MMGKIESWRWIVDRIHVTRILNILKTLVQFNWNRIKSLKILSQHSLHPQNFGSVRLKQNKIMLSWSQHYLVELLNTHETFTFGNLLISPNIEIELIFPCMLSFVCGSVIISVFSSITKCLWFRKNTVIFQHHKISVVQNKYCYFPASQYVCGLETISLFSSITKCMWYRNNIIIFPKSQNIWGSKTISLFFLHNNDLQNMVRLLPDFIQIVKLVNNLMMLITKLYCL